MFSPSKLNITTIEHKLMCSIHFQPLLVCWDLPNHSYKQGPWTSCCRPFWLERYQANTCLSRLHILFNWTYSMYTKAMILLHTNSLLTETWVLLKSVNSWGTAHCIPIFFVFKIFDKCWTYNHFVIQILCENKHWLSPLI